MKLSQLEEIILKNSSKINIKRGKELLVNGDLIKLNVHKADNFYNIYGNFKSENKLQSYSAHLKVDLIKSNIALAKCNCSIFKEGSTGNSRYLCEHIVATGLDFIDKVKKQLAQKKAGREEFRLDKNILNKLQEINNGEKYKEELDINITIKEVKENKSAEFDASFFIGNSNMHPITNIKEYIISYAEDKEYYIGKGLVYNSAKYYFSDANKRILDYILNYVLIAKKDISGNTIRIPAEILDDFLKLAVNKKIKFIYNYQNYISEVKNEDIPLTFTLKEIKNDYLLTTKKVMPVPLNKKKDIYFYDRNLYMPSQKQITIYEAFYETLYKSGKVIFKGDILDEELNLLIKSLNYISNNIYYDESIINKIGNSTKIKFNFSKKDNKYVCDVRIITDISDISYSEAVKINNEIINPLKKLRLIESEMNKQRFYFRNGRFEFLGNDDEYYEFLKNGIDYLESIGEVIKAESYNQYYRLNNELFKEVNLKENENGGFLFGFKMDGIRADQLKSVVKAYKENKSYIKLEDGIYVDLSDSKFKEAMKIIESLDLDIDSEKDEYEIQLNKLYYLNDKLESFDKVNGREKIKKMLKGINDKKDKTFDVPEELNCTLREYQLKGYNWFKNLSNLGFGGILADEMGLGKTVQTIAFLLSEEEYLSLIIAPTSLLYNWKEEIEKFAPHLKIGIVHGDKKHRKSVIDNYADYNILLTTYGTLRNDYEEYDGINIKNLILDEGQNINNHKAQISKIVKKISSKNRFVLTGTPIENNLNELWSLFDFIMPGYLSSNKKFTERFIKDENETLDDLKTLIAPYILRRLKKEVIGELPDKVEKKYLVEMTSDQKNIYKAFIKDIKDKLKSKENKSGIAIFTYLTRLRQICLDPSIVLDDYKGQSGKINKAKELIIENMSEHKILLFSQFTSALKKIEEELINENIDYCYLDGSVSSQNRMALVDEFNNNESKKVFLISLKAGGTGLNLTSADMVIHFDPWWNISAEEQATDRAHRIGQKHSVEVIKLIAKDTIEEKILMLQEDKKELIDNVITDELKRDDIVNQLTSNDIINLFSL